MKIDDLVDSIMAAGQKPSDGWEPFEEAKPVPSAHVIIDQARKLDATPFKLFTNNLYQVAVYEREPYQDGWPMMIHLSIKRLDREAIHDWRDLQRIKNELVGPEHEAVELYPAESRLVDTANQYHLFVMADVNARFPFGFGERWVSNTSEHGCVQRPFKPGRVPSDCMTTSEYMAKHKKPNASIS